MKRLRRLLWDHGATVRTLPSVVNALFRSHAGYIQNPDVEAAFREPPEQNQGPSTHDTGPLEQNQPRPPPPPPEQHPPIRRYRNCLLFLSRR